MLMQRLKQGNSEDIIWQRGNIALLKLSIATLGSVLPVVTDNIAGLFGTYAC